jgi:hypothetical protein
MKEVFIKEPRDYEQILDLSVYKDMIPDDEMNLDDVVKSLEDLSKYDKKISEELEKLEKSIARGYVFSSRLNF